MAGLIEKKNVKIPRFPRILLLPSNFRVVACGTGGWHCVFVLSLERGNKITAFHENRICGSSRLNWDAEPLHQGGLTFSNIVKKREKNKILPHGATAVAETNSLSLRAPSILIKARDLKGRDYSLGLEKKREISIMASITWTISIAPSF